jgi:hypothetical protein
MLQDWKNEAKTVKNTDKKQIQETIYYKQNSIMSNIKKQRYKKKRHSQQKI